MTKRLFDITASVIGLLILSPIFIIIPIWIRLDSNGSILYRQIRIGKDNIEFGLLKFRSMVSDADKNGFLTVGNRDPRITNPGYFIRKFKIDELPQLLNVLMGDMSLVGPRPEVRKYVDYYSKKQMRVLNIRPGITDVASIKYRNENEILKTKNDPENYYIKVIMNDKLNLNLEYIENRNLITDFEVILDTFRAIFIK